MLASFTISAKYLNLRLLKGQGIDISKAHLYIERWNGGTYVDVKDVHPFAQYGSLYD